MIHRKLMLCTLVICFLLASGVSAANKKEQSVDADIVWSESDGIRKEVFFTTRLADGWAEPEMITDDYFDNNSPVIEKDKEGNRWIFWSAYHNRTSEIRYTTRSADQWAEAQKLPSPMQSNVTPSFVFDGNGAAWVVWSANNGDLDDIYFSTNKDGNWSEPLPVHQPNNTVDALPVIDLEEPGRLVVTWKRLTDGRYESVASVWEDGRWGAEALVAEQQTDEQADQIPDLELPSFIADNTNIFLRIY
jgi:hypothetical protein